MAAYLPALIFGSVMGQTGQAAQRLQCIEYAGANNNTATCDHQTNLVCTEGCTGGVTVGGCTLGLTTAPITQERCTIGFNQTSAQNSTCINEQGSFLCSGIPSGQAICSGCVTSPPRNDVVPTGPLVGLIGATLASPSALNVTAKLVFGPVPTAATPIVPKHPPPALALSATSNNSSRKITAPVALYSTPAHRSSHAAAYKSPASNVGSDTSAGTYSSSADDSIGEMSSVAASNFYNVFAKSVVTISMIALGTVSL